MFSTPPIENIVSLSNNTSFSPFNASCESIGRKLLPTGAWIAKTIREDVVNWPPKEVVVDKKECSTKDFPTDNSKSSTFSPIPLI